MANLLDTFFGNTDQTQALGLLGAQWMAGNPAKGLLLANEHLAGAPDRDMQRKYRDMQMQGLQSEIAARQLKAQREQAELLRQQRIQREAPGLFKAPGMTGGEAVPQTFGGTDIPMFSRPMGTTPMQATPGGFDRDAAFRLGMKPDEISAYAGLQNIGRPKVARTLEVMRNGKPVTIQLDENGQEIGAGFEQWKAPLMQNLGGRTAAIDPVSLSERGSFAQSMSPSERDSSARGWASNRLAQQRFAFDKSGGADANKPPPGYRWNADRSGMEAIPGGPADQKAMAKASGGETVDNIVADLRGRFDALESRDGITSTDKGAIDNLQAGSASSGAGQMVGRLFGTKNQSERNSIAMARPLLLQAIMKASGMSAKQMDSNVELKLYLATATDPSLDVQANRAALDRIEQLYGSGGANRVIDFDKLPNGNNQPSGNPPRELQWRK